MAATPALSGKIADKSAGIGVLGLGYVGLPLSVEFARKGFHVRGFDVQKKIVESLKRGVSHVADVHAVTVKLLTHSGHLRPTTDFGELRGLDAVIICVPTPLRKSKEPDVSYIISAARAIAPHLRKGQLVVLESTTYPGTTRELVKPIFEKGGLKAGRDFFLAFSPERVDPGNRVYGIHNTPKVVGGISPTCTKMAAQLYSQVVEQVIQVSNSDAAEMVKLLENTFRSVNIGLVNELALMCHKLKLDVWEIINAAASKPFGYMAFYPGPGIGGHCIPLDPYYLAWKAKSVNFEPRFIELAGVINSSMPEFVVRRVAELLNEDGKALKRSRVLLLGMAYKSNVSDVRESPALDVLKLFADEGAQVSYHDPYVASTQVGGRRLASVPLSRAALAASDVVVILTAHASIDYGKVLRYSKRIFDARNALKGSKDRRVSRL